MPAITETEIQLYIDHCLPEERKRAVKEYLYDDLTAAQRVGAYERHADALRRELSPVAEMLLPSIFEPGALETQLSLSPLRHLNSIAGAMLAALIAYIGWGWGRMLEEQIVHFLIR